MISKQIGIGNEVGNTIYIKDSYFHYASDSNQARVIFSKPLFYANANLERTNGIQYTK